MSYEMTFWGAVVSFLFSLINSNPALKDVVAIHLLYNHLKMFSLTLYLHLSAFLLKNLYIGLGVIRSPAFLNQIQLVRRFVLCWCLCCYFWHFVLTWHQTTTKFSGQSWNIFRHIVVAQCEFNYAMRISIIYSVSILGRDGAWVTLVGSFWNLYSMLIHKKEQSKCEMSFGVATCDLVNNERESGTVREIGATPY